MMTETEDNLIHLGPNQRRILQLLQKKKSMTQRAIAAEIYGVPIKTGDLRYVAVNRSLLNLVHRGLLDKTSPEIQWSLKKKPKTKPKLKKELKEKEMEPRATSS